jgi:O-antigen/teichoic acid export membrane protein
MISRIKKGPVWLVLKRSMGIGFDSVISRLGANLTNILLPIYLSSYEIGIFNGAFKPFVLLAFSGESCMRFFSPYIAGIRDGSSDKIEEYLALMHKLVAFFSLTILIIPVFFSSSLISLVFGDQLLASAPYMSALAFGYVIYYLPPQSPPLMALSLEWKVIWCSIIRLCSNLIALIIFIPGFGIMGAVIAMNLSFFSYWVTTLILYRLTKLRPVKKPLKYFTFAATTFTLGWSVNKWFSEDLIGVFVFLIVSGLFSIIIYWDKEEKQMAILHTTKLVKKIRLGFTIQV